MPLSKNMGFPDFIKIDVEGAELQVLQGLTSSPEYLSFEFHSELHDIFISCIGQPCFSSEFTYILGEPSGKNSLARETLNKVSLSTGI